MALHCFCFSFSFSFSPFGSLSISFVLALQIVQFGAFPYSCLTPRHAPYPPRPLSIAIFFLLLPLRANNLRHFWAVLSFVIVATYRCRSNSNFPLPYLLYKQPISIFHHFFRNRLALFSHTFANLFGYIDRAYILWYICTCMFSFYKISFFRKIKNKHPHTLAHTYTHSMCVYKMYNL